MNFRQPLLLLAVALAAVRSTDSESPDCRTPEGAPGTCTVVQKCGPVYSLVKKMGSVTPQIQRYLQRAFCGFEGSYSKVCCIDQSRAKSKSAEPDRRTLLPQKCGEDNYSNRIVGGEIMGLDEFPWLALLEYQSPKGMSTGCGGALISKRYVLTAAHCVKSLPSSWQLKRVRLGEYNVNTDPDCLPEGDGSDVCADPVLVVPIEHQVVHENYGRPRSYSNDIALLRLDRDVEFTEFVRPVCLPSSADLGQLYWSAGWGQTEWQGHSSIKLKVSLPFVPLDSCANQYATKRVFLGDSQMCAGGKAGKDTCKGDSGGPLMRQVRGRYSNRWVVDGVVSLGHSPCGLPGWPAVYTKVHNYVPWIIQNLQP